MELTVNITTDGYRAFHRLHVPRNGKGKEEKKKICVNHIETQKVRKSNSNSRTSWFLIQDVYDTKLVSYDTNKHND